MVAARGPQFRFQHQYIFSLYQPVHMWRYDVLQNSCRLLLTMSKHSYLNPIVHRRLL